MNAPLQNNNELRQVLSEASQGSESAFRSVYDLMVDRIFSYVRSRVREREDAHDLVQDVFVDVWAALPNFTYISDAHFYGFVFTITKRKLARHYGKRMTESIEDLSPYDHPRVSPDIVDPDGMQNLVDELSDKYRDVILLRYWSGFSFAEIAEILDTTETNAKVRHHRAIKELQKIMEKHER